MDEPFFVTAPEALGEWMHARVLQTYGLASNELEQARLQRVQANLQRTRLMADRFQVLLLAGETILACTIPGPYIYIGPGLQGRLRTDDALAFVLAHEIAHHDLGHMTVYRKRLEMMGALPGSFTMAVVLTAAERFLFSPERELAADAHGLTYALNMGYDGAACLETFDILARHALYHERADLVYGPVHGADAAHPSAGSSVEPGVDQWITRANTWVWQHARGYPSIQERRQRLEALLPERTQHLQYTPGVTRLAPDRKPPKMNLDQIDQALETWRAKLLAVSDNLLALDDNITYRRLKAKDGLPVIRLTGVTQQRVVPALDAIQDLFQSTSLLTRVIDQATELRRSISRFRGAESTIREIEELLYGPSILMSTAQMPLAQRSLLSAAETTDKITPERLLAAMTETFEGARDAVFAVDAAWGKLETEIGKRETELATLQRLAETAGEGTMSELATARQKATALHAQIESDPLGARTNFNVELTPLLQSVRAQLGRVAQQRERIVIDLAKARELLAQLKETHRLCENALRECQERVGSATGLLAPLDEARIIELAQWLDTLETAWREGRWKPVGIGLERWLTTGTSRLHAEKSAYAANSAPVEMRAELRGRLAALQMKAKARGLALDTALAAIAQEAEALNHQYPVPLERIARLVSDYERQLAVRIK